MANSIGHDSIITEYIDKLIPKDLSGLKILDYGCYKGYWGWYLRSNRRGIPKFIFGVDVDSTLIPIHDRIKLYDIFCLAKADDNNIPEMVLEYGEYDLTLLTETLEHMNKRQGERILKELLEISKHIIITTPKGFMKNEIECMPYLKHKSGWNLKDFTKLKLNYQMIHRYPRSLRLYSKIIKIVKNIRTHGEFIIVWK